MESASLVVPTESSIPVTGGGTGSKDEKRNNVDWSKHCGIKIFRKEDVYKWALNFFLQIIIICQIRFICHVQWWKKLWGQLPFLEQSKDIGYNDDNEWLPSPAEKMPLSCYATSDYNSDLHWWIECMNCLFTMTCSPRLPYCLDHIIGVHRMCDKQRLWQSTVCYTARQKLVKDQYGLWGYSFTQPRPMIPEADPC